MTVQDTFCATLVDEWARAGIDHAVVSPGSRSTPLAAALAGDGRIRLHMVLDERSAGFVALGSALATGRPAVVVTTSGTAAAELHPAVVEASHARVPLVVCTADRPPELHGVGAPQTIEQSGLFGRAVRWRADPGVADAGAAGSWRSLAARCALEARASPSGPGPVHLNVAFRDPLVGTPGDLPPGREAGGPWHGAAARGAPAPPPGVVGALAAGRRGVVVAGAGAGDPDHVQHLAEILGWPVLADPLSGCRLPGPGTVAAADAILRSAVFVDRAVPEVVLRLGAPWASRTVGEWLARPGPIHILVDPTGRWRDPARRADHLVVSDAGALAGAVEHAGAQTAARSWMEEWATAEQAAQAAIEHTLAELAGPSEPGVARALAAALPGGTTLVVASSMPVRDVEWFAAPRHGLRVVANRGANGIDGVVSTAVGVAAGGRGPTVALVGDLAFLHDATGVLAARGAPEPVAATVVVVDNDGGGIFSFLPQASALEPATFERVVATPHGMDLLPLARALCGDASIVSDEKALVETIVTTKSGVGVRVIVIRTERASNVAAHARLAAAASAAVDACLGG